MLDVEGEVMEGVTTLPCGLCGAEDHGDLSCPIRTRETQPELPDAEAVRFALAIPTTADWMPERAASLARLKEALGHRPQWYREFRDRESNRVWPSKMWRWGLETGATHILQIQDDVIPAPNFWPALRAMVEAQPDRIIGLHANHPLTPVQFRAGRRWYRDHWVTGPAYVFPRAELAQFVAWTEAHPDLVANTNEDSLISHWAYSSKVTVWHPIPAITDHDLGVPSTYGNDAHHEFSMFRRPAVTWRDVPSLAALEDPAYWRCTEESAPMLPGPGTQGCWFCAGARQSKIVSAETGARICPQCVGNIVGQALGRLV